MSWNLKNTVVATAMALATGVGLSAPATAVSVASADACKAMISQDALEAAVGVKMTDMSGKTNDTGKDGAAKSRCYFHFANGAVIAFDLSLYADEAGALNALLENAGTFLKKGDGRTIKNPPSPVGDAAKLGYQGDDFAILMFASNKGFGLVVAPAWPGDAAQAALGLATVTTVGIPLLGL